MSWLRRWLRRLLRWLKRSRVDTSVFTHVYTGPTTKDRLTNGAPVRIVGKNHRDPKNGRLGKGASGGRLCATPDGKQWLLAREHLEKAS